MFKALIFIYGGSLFPLATYASDVLCKEHDHATSNDLHLKNFPFPPSPPLSPYEQLSLSRASAPSPLPTAEQKQNNISLEMIFKDGFFKGCSRQSARGCLATCGILSVIINHAKEKSMQEIISLTNEDFTELVGKEKADAHQNCIAISLRALKTARHRIS